MRLCWRRIPCAEFPLICAASSLGTSTLWVSCYRCGWKSKHQTTLKGTPLKGKVATLIVMFLPPASEGWGKVIFSVCQSTPGGRGYPHLLTGMGGVPRSGPDDGGIPNLPDGGGYSILPNWGVPPSGLDSDTPPPQIRTRWGTLLGHDWMGVPPLPIQD